MSRNSIPPLSAIACIIVIVIANLSRTPTSQALVDHYVEMTNAYYRAEHSLLGMGTHYTNYLAHRDAGQLKGTIEKRKYVAQAHRGYTMSAAALKQIFASAFPTVPVESEAISPWPGGLYVWTRTGDSHGIDFWLAVNGYGPTNR